MVSLLQKQTLFQGITQPEERLLFAKVLDQAALSCKRHCATFTDFLDMAKSGKFLERLQYHSDLQVMAFGGIEDSERRMLGFAPDYMTLTEDDFPICALRITKHPKFGQTDLSHRDYLGSILGLGIDRGKIGDILVGDTETICLVQEDIADYIVHQLQKVSHTPVQVKHTVLTDITVEKKIEIRRFTTASLRLDAVAGAALHLARGKIQTLIAAEKVTINWSTTTNTSCLLKEGDMISVRGYGRFRIHEIGGKSKKERIGLEVGVYV